MKARTESRGSRGIVVVKLGSRGIDDVIICARSEEEQREATEIYEKIRSSLDQIDQIVRGGDGTKG